jgi:hypothetical protein
MLLYIMTSKSPPLNKQLSNIIFACTSIWNTTQIPSSLNFIPTLFLATQPDTSNVNGPEIFSTHIKLKMSFSFLLSLT